MVLSKLPIFSSSEGLLETALGSDTVERVSGIEQRLFIKFERLFTALPFFRGTATDDNELPTHGLPNLILYPPSCSEERPMTVCSLLNGLPTKELNRSKRLKRFVNKDVLLYVHSPADWHRDGRLARDLFRAWYPYRPPLPTHVSVTARDVADQATVRGNSAVTASPHDLLPQEGHASANVSSSKHPKATSKRPKGLPTRALAYLHLEHAFCSPMRLDSEMIRDSEVDLTALIPAHIALVDSLIAILDDINIENLFWVKGWSRGLVRLSGGYRSGFCIHDGPMVVGEERYNGEKRDTRSGRTLQVVGREAWVRRGWVNAEQDLRAWHEVKGLTNASDQDNGEDGPGEGKWLMRRMGFQEAVEGIIRASGEECRFQSKPVSQFFEDEFLNPPVHTEEEIRQFKAHEARFTQLVEEGNIRAREVSARAKQRAMEEEQASREPQTRSWYGYLRGLFGL